MPYWYLILKASFSCPLLSKGITFKERFNSRKEIRKKHKERMSGVQKYSLGPRINA
jgi:hypothetical protein